MDGGLNHVGELVGREKDSGEDEHGKHHQVHESRNRFHLPGPTRHQQPEAAETQGAQETDGQREKKRASQNHIEDQPPKDEQKQDLD